ncbi:hypothetical protein NC652_006737 [Populus alba x Populus x berolinensis]|nr:hypothetical protein NC652_006737 [Populus alba x Populus x berolinensis]
MVGLFEECFLRRWYRTAACYILVIAKLEGPAVSQYCALQLLQATLDESLYDLAGELVRFLLRSGKEYDQTSTDSDIASPRFLGYFLFHSSYKKPSLDKSNSLKEQSAHIASVKSILESHASYLMSGKELSKLVAFVKGTQFDLVEYLQRERYGSARLENFASGLELIGQKLQMGMLQSRLDAEFLLAHMCSVKFKEWIVVLATLLRRAELVTYTFGVVFLFFFIFSSMISGCGKHIASPFRYASFKALLINVINKGGVFMGILPRLPDLCSSRALHFLNTMICLKAWKRDSHLYQICKRNEGGFGSLTRFPGKKKKKRDGIQSDPCHG